MVVEKKKSLTMERNKNPWVILLYIFIINMVLVMLRNSNQYSTLCRLMGKFPLEKKKKRVVTD